MSNVVPLPSSSPEPESTDNFVDVLGSDQYALLYGDTPETLPGLAQAWHEEITGLAGDITELLAAVSASGETSFNLDDVRNMLDYVRMMRRHLQATNSQRTAASS